MPSQFETFVLVEQMQSISQLVITKMIRTYDDKARGEDALKLLCDTCRDRMFDLITVEHVD